MAQLISTTKLPQIISYSVNLDKRLEILQEPTSTEPMIKEKDFWSQLNKYYKLWIKKYYNFISAVQNPDEDEFEEIKFNESNFNIDLYLIGKYIKHKTFYLLSNEEEEKEGGEESSTSSSTSTYSSTTSSSENILKLPEYNKYIANEEYEEIKDILYKSSLLGLLIGLLGTIYTLKFEDEEIKEKFISSIRIVIKLLLDNGFDVNLDHYNDQIFDSAITSILSLSVTFNDILEEEGEKEIIYSLLKESKEELIYSLLKEVIGYGADVKRSPVINMNSIKDNKSFKNYLDVIKDIYKNGEYRFSERVIDLIFI